MGQHCNVKVFWPKEILLMKHHLKINFSVQINLGFNLGVGGSVVTLAGNASVPKLPPAPCSKPYNIILYYALCQHM